jgi:hypothetical protein
MTEARRIPTALEVSWAVARVTFTEILRDKILYNVFLCGVFLIILGYLASRLSFIMPERILLDFGHSAIAISCSMIAIFFGAGLIGICGVLVANWVLFGLVYVGVLLFLKSLWWVSPMTGTLAIAIVFALLQSFVLVAAAIFFSTFSTTSLSVIFTIGLYLVGTNTSYLHKFAAKLGDGWQSTTLHGAIRLIPDLETYDLGLRLTYGVPIDATTILLVFLYTFAVCAILVLLAGFLVRSRDV